MTKKEHIRKLYSHWNSSKLSVNKIEKRVGTADYYVLQVFSAFRMEMELYKKEIDKETGFQVSKPKKEIIEPDFEWEDLIPKTIKVKPKVNLLPDGKVELIYKSKM